MGAFHTELLAVRRAVGVLVVRVLARAQSTAHNWAFGEPVWISSDGTAWPIHEMTDPHLRNCIKKLRRDRDENQPLYTLLIKEQQRRVQEEKRRRQESQRKVTAEKWAKQKEFNKEITEKNRG